MPNRLIKFTFSIVIFSALVLGFQNCSLDTGFKTGQTESANSTSNVGDPGAPPGGSGTPAPPGSGTPIPQIAQFRIESNAVSSMNLGSQQALTLNISSLNGFSGGVDISVDSATLKLVDPNSSVSALLEMSHVSIGAGGSAPVGLQLKALESAPTLNSNIDIVVTESNPPSPRPAFKTVLHVPVKVLAVYEIKISGPAAAQETWSSPKVVNFAQHKEGVLIRYINTANVAHEVHSAGPIPHMKGQLAAGATYEFMVMNQNKTTDTYYCHLHESAGAAARQLVFNASIVALPPPKSGNPNATFTYLNANVLPKCTGCHGVAMQAKGIDLSSYAKVVSSVANVVPGNADASGLYVETENGTMPLGGVPLLAVQVQAIKDWINDGALNN